MRRPVHNFAVIALGLATVWLVLPAEGHAQGGRNKAASTRALDAKASQVLETFVKDSLTVALEYEQAGEPERAKHFLEAVLKIHPDAEALKERLKALDEQLLSANELHVEIEPGKGWGSPVAQVAKGKKIRIQASGTYRLVVTATLGPDGLPTGDPVKGEMAEGITCGALMGVVMAKDKPGKPFAIESGREYAPEQDGLLFLRLNTPPGSKCTGRVQAKLSGALVRAQ